MKRLPDAIEKNTFRNQNTCVYVDNHILLTPVRGTPHQKPDDLKQQIKECVGDVLQAITTLTLARILACVPNAKDHTMDLFVCQKQENAEDSRHNTEILHLINIHLLLGHPVTSVRIVMRRVLRTSYKAHDKKSTIPKCFHLHRINAFFKLFRQLYSTRQSGITSQ